MRPEDAGEGVTVPSQVGDDALGIVPVNEYETVFSFPTVGKDSELCVTQCHGFWLTFYVDDARSDSGQGPGARQTKYARSMRAFKVRASKRDPPKFFVSTPPAGLFSHRDIVWQCDVQWPYEKSASNWLHAVIPAERLLDFRRGVQCDAATEFRVYSRYKKGRGTSSVGSLYTNITIWHCFCGPEDHSVEAKEKFVKLCSGKAKRISRKVGCQCRFQSVGFSEKFTFMPCEGGAPLDSKFVRIRWPLKNAVPVWHANHEVVPSWPASSETKRALCAFIQQHTSVSDAFVLRRWREHITTNVMRAENVTREVLNARLAGGTLTFPRQYYISVHDVKRVRQRVTSVKWKRDASEMVSLLEFIIEDEGMSVTRFRNMEIAPACVRGRFVDDAFDGESRNARFECAWCDYKTQVSKGLQEHMESCVHGFKDGEYADAGYISKYVRSCESGKPLATYEAEETSANSAWWSTEQVFIRSKLSATYDFITKNMNELLSPGKQGTGNLETALVVYEPKENEEMSLEESARREREARLLAYWDEAPDWSLDRILSEEQHKTIDDAFATSGDEEAQVSAGPSHARFCPVSVKSLQTLKDGRWLNDEVINWQLALLNDIAYERSVAREEEHPRVHFFPTATLSLMSIANWMSKTRESEREKKIGLHYEAKLYYDYDRVKKMLRKKTPHPYDCLDCRTLFFPVHWGDHWAAVIVSVKKREVYYLDSMGCSDHAQRGWHITCDVARLMRDALRERDKESSFSDWKVYQKNTLKFDVPYQLNGHDCGMFMLSFARHVLNRGIDNTPMSKFNFRTQHMAHRRRVVAFEILTVGVQHAVPAPEDVEGDVHVQIGTGTAGDALDRKLEDYIQEKENTLSTNCGVRVRSNTIGDFYNCPASKLPRIRVDGELRVVVKPFCLIIMNPVQANWMWRYGHKSGVQMDSTFGTNKARYSLFTLVVRHDSAGMGLPGAWVITSDERTETIAYCLKSIRESLRASRPESARGEWTPNAFIVDCALSELAAVRQVFGESVAIFWCHWHVMQAMKRRAMNVTKKYREKIMRDVFSLVRDFVPHDVKEGLDNFYRKMNTFMEFCKTCDDATVGEYGKYFERQWLHTYRLWAKVFRTCGKYGIDTTSTAESYHNFIKSLAREEDNSRWLRQRRMDWLCSFLLDVALSQFVAREHVSNLSLPDYVRSKYLKMLQEYGRQQEDKNVEFKLTHTCLTYCPTERKDIMESTVVTITDKNSADVRVHKVANLHLLRCCALQRLHQLVTCNCTLGMNDELCLAKLHAMSQASEAYTLGALDLNQNVKSEPLDLRAQGNRRMSDEDIKKLGKSKSSSGVNSVATVMRISQELQDVKANMMNVEKIRDPNAQRKVLLHYQAANKLMEEVLLKEKDEDARGENTHVTPPRTSQIGVGVHTFASPTGNLPRIEHEKRSELNDDTLQRGKGALERAKRRRQSGGGGAAKLHK